MFETCLKNLNTHVLYFALSLTTVIYQDVKKLLDNMWVLKLIFLDTLFTNFYILNDLLCTIVDIFSFFSFSKLGLVVFFASFHLARNTALVFSLKLILSVMLLILVRGGTPRYRYDYLTKLGWLKFLGLVVVFFLTTLLVYLLF